MPDDPVTRKQLLQLTLNVQTQLALHTNDFDDPEYSIMNSTLRDTTDMIHALVADTLYSSAQKITKITAAIKIETGELNDVTNKLTQIKNFAGQAADVINAVTLFLPYLA